MGGLRLRVLEGFGTLVLAVLAGCGGRSSVLEPDSASIAANQPAGGSTATPPPNASVGATGNASSSGGKGLPTGGNSGVPAGGRSSSGSAGSAAAGGSISGAGGAAGSASGGSAGLDSAAFSKCDDYCTASAQPRPCPSGFSPLECTSSCTSELSAYGPECQGLGIALLDCLTTVYKHSSSCSEVDRLSLAKCSALFTSYQACVAPTPHPVPTPDPPPLLTCSSSGSSSNGKCSLDVKCTSGAYYSVSCYQTGADQSTCTCNASFPDGSASGGNFGLNENASFACYDSLATCGFPQVGAP